MDDVGFYTYKLLSSRESKVPAGVLLSFHHVGPGGKLSRGLRTRHPNTACICFCGGVGLFVLLQ